VAGIVGQWAGVPEPFTTAETVGRRQAVVRSELFKDGSERVKGWRLTLSHPDTTDPLTTWTVSVAGLADEKTEVFVRLERTRQGTLLLPSRDHPAPPGCIRALMEANDLEVVDAGWRMATEVIVPEDDQASEIAALVTSPDRRLPVFAFTPRDEDVIDGWIVLNQIIGLAHVMLIRSSLSWGLDDVLPLRFNVYGGAARLWWPGVTARSTRWDHPLWPSDVPAARIRSRAVEAVVDAAIASASTDARFSTLERRNREREYQRLESEVFRLQSEFDRALEYAGASDTGSEAVALANAVKQLIDSEANRRRHAEEDLSVYEALATQYEGELLDFRRRAGSAELERDHWRNEFERLHAAGAVVPIADDTLAAFGAEIESEITNRGDVEGARRRAFTVGRRFLAMLDSMGTANRSKIIKACADVVMNAPSLLRRRDDHPFRTGEGANDAFRHRSSDRAEARRCSIEQNVPSARRLHYWVLADGSVELASVNLHDDLAIPE